MKLPATVFLYFFSREVASFSMSFSQMTPSLAPVVPETEPTTLPTMRESSMSFSLQVPAMAPTMRELSMSFSQQVPVMEPTVVPTMRESSMSFSQQVPVIEPTVVPTMRESSMSFSLQVPAMAPTMRELSMSFSQQVPVMEPTVVPTTGEFSMSFSMSFSQQVPSFAPTEGIPFSFVFTDSMNFDNVVANVFSFSYEEEASFSYSMGAILDVDTSPVASVRGVIGIDSSELPTAESRNQLVEDIAAAVGVPASAVIIEETLVGSSSTNEVSRRRNRNQRRHLSQTATYTWTTVFTVTTTLVVTYSSCGCTSTASLATYVTETCSAPSFPPPCTTCNVGPVQCRPKPPPPCYCCEYCCTCTYAPTKKPTNKPTYAPTLAPTFEINEAVALLCPYPDGPEDIVSGFVKVEDTATHTGVEFSGRLLFPSGGYIGVEGFHVRVHAGFTCEDADEIYNSYCPWRGPNSAGGPFACTWSSGSEQERNDPWTTELTVTRVPSLGGRSGQAIFFQTIEGRPYATGSTLNPTFSVNTTSVDHYRLLGHAVVVSYFNSATQLTTRVGCGILNMFSAQPWID